MQNVLAKACDYTQPITDEDLEKVFSYWETNLEERRPSPAIIAQGGEVKATDLDMASFLQAITRRGAVINIPEYKGRRPKSVKAGERVLSKENRHGKLMGLFANKELFSFGIRILDANVITSTAVGAPRNFMLVDVTGEWYDGWQSLEWMPDAKENEFLTKNKLWTGSDVVFKYFVHPALANSIYGGPYRTVKALAKRLTEESAFLGTEVKRLVDAGCKFPPADGPATEYPVSEKGEGKSISVKAYEFDLDIQVQGAFKPLSATDESLVTAYRRRKLLSYNTVPMLTFILRTVEMAFIRHNSQGFGKWEKNFKIPKKRIEWNRYKLDDEVYLRGREMDKSTTVAAD